METRETQRDRERLILFLRRYYPDQVLGVRPCGRLRPGGHPLGSGVIVILSMGVCPGLREKLTGLREKLTGLHGTSAAAFAARGLSYTYLRSGSNRAHT